MPTTAGGGADAPVNASTPTAYDGVERELNEDAAWKRIQENTFTRWANEHLKRVNLRVDNLGNDLSDGLLLIRLIEVLSHKRLGKYNTKPGLRAQKLENVSMALRFLEIDEGLRLVNIDSSAIVDNKLKLILGLIWTLILHYSMSVPFDDGGQEKEKEKATKQNGASKETPKQRLMSWIQERIPQNGIKNFTSDWHDGRALGALVDAVAPGLCTDWDEWRPQDALENTTKAMDKADAWLGVPKLIEPHEFINPEADERSMMTYLSQYPHAKLRPGAPLMPWTPKSKIIATGPGLQSSGLVAGQQTDFMVDVSGTNLVGQLEAIITHTSSGKHEPINVQYSDVSKTYFVTYTPHAAGAYEVRLAYAGREIPKSPFNVHVNEAKKEPIKVHASGPGLESGVRVGKLTNFNIHMPTSGSPPEVAILDETGKQDSVKVDLRKISDGQYQCDYVAHKAGLHSVNIFYEGQSIPGSPYGVPITSLYDAKSVRAVGRGLQPKGVRVGDLADFHVFTENAGEGGIMEVLVTGADGEHVPLVEAKQLTPTKYYYAYKPTHPGRHDVAIVYGGSPVARSPFPVHVGPHITSKIRAYGPGLEGGMVNSPCVFTVETNGETGSLGFSIEGPSKAQIKCHDNGDGSAEVSYMPTTPGDYAVHILCNDENIPSSPFIAHIEPFIDHVHPESINCYGPGLQEKGVARGRSAEFVVDASKAGPGMTKIWAIDRDYEFVDIKVQELGNQVYSCAYVPTKATRHTIIVSHAGVGAPGSPYRVLVEEPVEPSKVSVYGPGVQPGVRSQHPTHFMIDCKQAGAGEVEVALSDDKGSKVDIDVLENSNGTFTVKYTAPRPGTYQLRVVFAGAEIPGSPIRINVLPHLDLGGVRVEGLDSEVFVGALASFVVDCQSTDREEETNEEHLHCVLTAPSKKSVKCQVKRAKRDVYNITYVPQEEGEHTLDLAYEGVPLHEFHILARTGQDPSKCKAYGEGLERGYVGFPCRFMVETKGAGPGTVNVLVEGPSELEIDSKEKEDGSRVIEYIPSLPGEYFVSLRFDNTHIPGSPFRVMIDYPVDASKVSAWGPGLEQKNCRAKTPLHFHVDASRSGFAPLNVTVLSDDKSHVLPLPEIRERASNTYDITYHPSDVGTTCNIHITYGGTDIPNSPFRMQVLPPHEAGKVRLSSGEDVVPLGEIPASLPYTFTIDTRDAGYADLAVTVLGPNQYPCPVDVVDRGDGVYDVTIVPEDVGPYNVVIKYGGDEITQSPYHLVAQPIGDASKCIITEGLRDRVAVNEEYSITVNAANAGGAGLVNCRILPATQNPDSCSVHVEDNNDGTFSIYYTLRFYDTYTIMIKFGGQLIPQGEWNISAVSLEDLQKVDEPIIHSLQYEGEYTSPDSAVGKLVPVELKFPAAIVHELSAEVIMPSKRVDHPSLHDNGDGTVTIKYSPKEAGPHEMHIKHNGEHVQGSPLEFYVHTPGEGFVTAYGQGLVYGTSGHASTFTVVAKEKVPAGLTVYIEGPSKAEIKCTDNYDGTCTVSWLPTVAGTYKIHVKYDDKEIRGSPFTAKVAGEISKRAHMAVGSASEISLEIADGDDRALRAAMTSPSGADVPCIIRRLDDGHLGISFTPYEIGEYLVYVYKDNELMPGSPFRVLVSEKDVGNVDKVKLYGPGLSQAITQQFNEFTVDTREAGFGGLVVSVEGPSKCEIDCKTNKDNTSSVLYWPTEPGIYVLSVKFGDQHVNGSPFTVKCQGAGLGTVSEHVQQMREHAHQATPGNPCDLRIRIPGASLGHLTGSLVSPSGKMEDVEVVDIGDNFYVVRFVPRDIGVHTISVLHKGQHISGSPYLFTVGPFKDGGGAHKVRASGMGLRRGFVDQPANFSIYMREAGQGNVSLTIEGPGKAKIDFKDHRDDICNVTYSVAKPGDYKISIKFDEMHIPESPFLARISGPAEGASKVEIVPLPTSVVAMNKPTILTVLTHGAKGYLDAKVASPSGVVDDCFITPSDDGESFAITFIPQELGFHYVHIKFDDINIAHSPVRVSVVERLETDISEIMYQSAQSTMSCSGLGLQKAYIGRKNAFTVDCTKAGDGDARRLLFVAVMTPNGPSDDVSIKYMGQGKYGVEYSVKDRGTCFVHVKYGDENAPGSPFKVEV